MPLAQLSAGFHSLLLVPTSKLGPVGADSQVDGFGYILGPYGSLQLTLLWGWEFLLLPPQPPQVFQSVVWGFISPRWNSGLRGLWLGLPAAASLPAAALPTPLHNLPPHWVCQPLPCRVPVSTPTTCLDECFFFNSLVVRLPYSLIFCQFWLFFVFKLLLSFFWLCKEAQCVSILAGSLAL